MCCRSLVASGSHRLALVRRPRWLRGRRAERGFALPHTACDCTPLGQTASSAPCLPPVPAARRKAPSWKAPSSACHNCGYPGGLDVWLRAWAALRTLEERPSPPDPSGSTPCGPQTVPQSPSSAPHPILSTVPPASYPSLHILSSPPPDSTSYHNPISHRCSGAWQWGGSKRACSAVLVLLVGCVLPGGGASTSPAEAAPTTGASLEGSSDSSSPGRSLSDSMAKVRGR